MIEIKIVDPQTLDNATLVATATYLMALAGHTLSATPVQPHDNYDTIAEPIYAQSSDLIPIADMCGYSQPEAIETPFNPFSNINETTDKRFDALDTNGLPWDVRIHARTKTRTANGVWKLKRGVDAKAVDTIEAELTQVMAVPSPPPASPMPAIMITSVEDTESQDLSLIPKIMSFPELVTRLSKLIAEGKISQMQMLNACKAEGIPSLPLVAARLDLVPAINARIDALLTSDSVPSYE